VTNTGGSGDGDLGYGISFGTPGGPVAESDVLAPGDSETWQAPRMGDSSWILLTSEKYRSVFFLRSRPLHC